MSMEYKGGYRTEVPRYKLIPGERILFEKHIEIRDLVDLAGRIERGEPHEVNPNYGGQGYTYLYPESEDLGRVKVTLTNFETFDEWELVWEDGVNG